MDSLVIRRKLKAVIHKSSHLLRESLVINAGYLFGILMVSSLVGVVFWVLTTRFYSQRDVGLASAIISIVQLLASIALIGINAGLVRFLANANDSSRMINTALTFSILTTLLVGGIYLLGISFWSPTLQFLSQTPGAMLFFLAFIAATVCGSVLQAVFQAYRQSQYAFWQVVTMNVVRLALTVILASTQVTGIIAAVIVGAVVSNGLGLLVFMPMVVKGYRIRFGWSMIAIRRLVPYSVGNYVSDILYRAPMLLAPLLALELLGPESSANVYIAWMLGWMASSLGQALGGAALAEGAFAPGNLRQILTKAGYYAVGVTILLAVLVGICAQWIMALFGEHYSDGAVGLLRWFMVAAPFMAINVLYFTALRVRNRIGELIKLSAMSGIIALAIPVWGMTRIGIATIGMGWLGSQAAITVIASFRFLPFRVGRQRLPEPSLAHTRLSSD